MGCISAHNKTDHGKQIDLHTLLTNLPMYNPSNPNPRVSRIKWHPRLNPIIEARSYLELSASYGTKEELPIQVISRE